MNNNRSNRRLLDSRDDRFRFETLEPRNMLAVGLGSGLEYVNFDNSSLIYNLQPGYASSEQMNVLRTHVGAGNEDSFRLISSSVDELGITHAKYQQVFSGIDVAGGSYTVHSSNGKIAALSGNFVDVDPSVPVYAGLGNDLAANRALDYMNQRPVVDHDTGVVLAEQPKQFVWNDPVLAEMVGLDGPLVGDLTYFTTADNQVELVYRFELYVIEPVVERTYIFVNANSGVIEGDLDLIHDADVAASGTSLYDGTVNFTADAILALPITYRLRQAAEGVETYNLNNSTSYGSAVDFISPTTTFNAAGQDIGVQAHWGTENTLAYYQTIHGRNSFDDAGAILRSYVSYGTNYVNAFWNGAFMTYGDGNGTSYGPLVSLDVVGHEITHGVTEYSANLVYSYESGALNESFSDIFGESVERFARGANDWAIGGDFDLVDGDGFRSMSDPKAKGDPDTYMGINWYAGTADNGGVHTNSGVQNKWFYILSVGEAGTNDHGFVYNVTGIGQDDAEAIAYRNLTTYLTSGSTYQDAREGAIQAAIDLFGAGSQQHISTDKAWEAVGLYDLTTGVEFHQLAPEGSLIYEANYSGVIGGGNLFDTYTLSLDAQQSLTVVVRGEEGLLDPFVTIIDGNALPIYSSGPVYGNNTVLANIPITQAQVLAVKIEGGLSSGSYDVQFLLNADSELETLGGLPNSSLLEAVSLDPSVVELGDTTSINADRLATVGFVDMGQAPTLVEDFEAGPPLGPNWTTWHSHPAGQINVTSAYGASQGTYALVLEQGTFGAFNLNEAILTIDMTAPPSTVLAFDHVSFGDENHELPAQFAGSFNGDGVAVSDDGLNWYTVMTNITPDAGVWEPYFIDLQQVADANPGLDLVADFKIKFQQYDDMPVSFGDGRGFDNIGLGNTVLGDDWYSFSADSNEIVTIAGTKLDATSSVQIELYNAAETLLATGVPGGIVESLVSQYQVSAAGQYFVRVSGDGDYSLLVTRDANFDAELPGSQDITNVNGVLGHVRAFTTLVAEPDEFPDGALLDTAFPGVALTTGAIGNVYAATAPFQAPTGNNVFAPTTGTAAGWRESDGTVLRATFGQDQGFVSIDVGSDDSSDQGVLRAYDFLGNLLAEVFSGSVTNGSSETISIARATNDISYVEASGVGGNLTPLDHLVYKRHNIDQDIYAIDVVAGEFINLEGFLPGGGPADFTNLLGEGAVPALSLVLEDPTLAVVATGTTTLQHIAAMTGTYRVTVAATDATGEYYLGHVNREQTAWYFDLNWGTSPTEPGFQPLYQSDSYNATAGYGWTSLSGATFSWADAAGTNLDIDGIATTLAEFAANVPDGDYEVELFFGNRPATLTQRSLSTLEGNVYDLSPPKNSSVVKVVSVTDGRFNMKLDGFGGTVAYAYLSGLSITPLTSTEWKFDLDATGSPTAAGFTSLPQTQIYNPVDRFGWTSLSSATFMWADPAGTDLEIDGIATTLAEFAADVLPGDYEVELIFGNRPAALTQRSLFTLEGNVYDLSPPKNSSVVKIVSVTDGQFNLTLDGFGTVAYAYLSGLRITPLTSTEWMFDLDATGSPTAAGFTSLPQTQIYNPVDRFGWTSLSSATFMWADPAGTDLEIDGIATTLAEFAADVLPGDYEVELYFGNRPATLTQRSLFTLEGNVYDLSPPKNTSFVTVVSVTDGQFNMTLDGFGGTVTYAYLSGLRITPLTTEWKFDLDATGSPTAAGFTSLPQTQIYNPVDRYGLTNLVNATMWLDPAGTDLEIDGIRTTLADFAADVQPGDYEVELYFGNRPTTLTQRSLFTLEGRVYDLSPPANTSFVTIVSVTDGQFNLTLDGFGGTVAYAYLSGLRVTPIAPIGPIGFAGPGDAGQPRMDAATLADSGLLRDIESQKHLPLTSLVSAEAIVPVYDPIRGNEMVIDTGMATAALVRNDSGEIVVGSAADPETVNPFHNGRFFTSDPVLAGAIQNRFLAAGLNTGVRSMLHGTGNSLPVKNIDQFFADSLEDVFLG